MIVMVQQGRLGNQLFQYLALRSVASENERLLLLGFSSLRHVFDGVDATFIDIDGNPLRHLQSVDYARWAPRINGLPWTGTIIEGDDAAAVRATGSRLAFVEPAWFQTASALRSPAAASLRIKERSLQRARGVLSDAGINLSRAAFLHVRGGDYRSWPSTSAPAILSPQWYRERMSELRHVHPGVHFVALGDDVAFIREVIDGVSDVTPIMENEATEFAVMSLCPSGILSASSFAFWGAYFAQRNNPSGVYLAPMFWAGHVSRVWYPPHIESAFLTYR